VASVDSGQRDRGPFAIEPTARVDILRGGSSMPLAAMLKSAVLFVAAGLCEIGGGYLVWQWLRNGRGLAMGAVGGVVLFLYGVIPTLQPPTSRGSMPPMAACSSPSPWLGAGILDGQRPDRYDLLDGLLCLRGVGVIMYSPRAWRSGAALPDELARSSPSYVLTLVRVRRDLVVHDRLSNMSQTSLGGMPSKGGSPAYVALGRSPSAMLQQLAPAIFRPRRPPCRRRAPTRRRPAPRGQRRADISCPQQA